jgi:hypothetical protein
LIDWSEPADSFTPLCIYLPVELFYRLLIDRCTPSITIAGFEVNDSSGEELEDTVDVQVRKKKHEIDYLKLDDDQ